MVNELTFRTKLWKRSQNSHATTIPQPILAARGVPVDEDVEVVWRIDSETRNIVVEFELEDDE
ncbi:hypothetical protein [Haloarcula marina]|uniref:hypothetical protein n=1 Tax=Haloarcula marina TaxID=2961574 RepID=UPI0020B889E6|nr:hypothetical protein [Halomicroarcula marina]